MRHRMIAFKIAHSRAFPLLLAVLCIAAFAFYAGAQQSEVKEIAITFDNLPATTSFGFSDQQAINEDILDALRTHKVTATGFVVGDAIEGHFDLLGSWLNDGHTLGSMTLSNQDLHDVDPGRFFEDAKMGADMIEPMLDGFGQKKRYFRFPFLHYGSTDKIKNQATSFFRSRSVVIAHASIVPEDYLYDFNIQKLGRRPDSTRLERIGDEYLHHIFDVVAEAEGSAEELRGRPVRQILLLRANRINGYFLPDILAGLQERGYQFVTLDRALSDDVYRMEEHYTDGRGIGFLDRVLQSNPQFANKR